MKSDTIKFNIEIHTQTLNLTTVTTLHDLVMEITYDEVKVFFNNKWLAGFQRNPEILYSDIKLDVDFVKSISNSNYIIFADKIKETILEYYE